MAKTKQARGTCTVSGCSKPHHSRGYCGTHLQRFKRGVDVFAPVLSRDRTPHVACKEEGCSAPVKSKGLCQMHYARSLRHGHTKHRDRTKMQKSCTVKGCENWFYASGLCNQHYVRQTRLQAKYGLTLADVDKLLAAQGGVCAICRGQPRAVDGRSRKIKDWCVDHCHETGKVRGILCDHCNRSLGLFQDDPSILRRAADYLESSRGQTKKESSHGVEVCGSGHAASEGCAEQAGVSG